MAMRSPFLTLALCLAWVGLSAAPASPEASAASFAVLRSEVRFGSEGGSGSRLILQGDLTAGPALATFDPTAVRLRFAVGPLTLIDGPAWPGAARFRQIRSGWRLDLRGLFGGRGRAVVRLHPANGRFTVDVRGFEGADLLAAGPAGVAVAFQVDDEIYAAVVDFEAKGARRWTFRLRVDAPPPGGGGGTGDPDPILSGIVSLAEGEQSGITSFRFEAIRDQATWDVVWAQHAGSGSPPAVDFSRDMILGVWLGMRPTGGYSVSIWRVTAPYMVVTAGWCPPCYGEPCPGAPCFGGETVSGALADVRETKPGSNCVVTQSVTYPFRIVRVARVEGPFVYTLDAVTRDCP